MDPDIIPATDDDEGDDLLSLGGEGDCEEQEDDDEPAGRPTFNLLAGLGGRPPPPPQQQQAVQADMGPHKAAEGSSTVVMSHPIHHHCIHSHSDIPCNTHNLAEEFRKAHMFVQPDQSYQHVCKRAPILRGGEEAKTHLG